MSAKIRFATIACFVLLLTALPSFAFGERSLCIAADISAPIILPDGSEHERGRLKLCLTVDYSPVSALHEITVNDVALGVMPSRRGVSEGSDSEPFMLFRRHIGGQLELYGYAIPQLGQVVTYVLHPMGGSTESTVQTWSSLTASVRR